MKVSHRPIVLQFLALLLVNCKSAADGVDRTVLPICEPEYPPYTELDVRNTEPPPRFQVTAPEGAPNVAILLIDDLGFGATSTFGGPIPTPTLDRLAKAGLRYNNFHTTALCSPTRVALKSGRNHHTANAGSIMETATAYPGNTGAIPNRVAPLAEGRASGALLVQGGRFGGWSLHVREGRPAYEYNFLGLERAVVECPNPLPPGKATVTLEFAYDGGGPGKGGEATLKVNGTQVAEGRIGRTQPNIFSADETADVGLDNQTPVAQGIGYGPEETRFNGRIEKITLEVK